MVQPQALHRLFDPSASAAVAAAPATPGNRNVMVAVDPPSTQPAPPFLPDVLQSM